MRTTHLPTAAAAALLLIGAIALPAVAQQAPPLTGGEWELELLHGEALPAEVEITVRFNDDRVSGDAPINRYFASYVANGETLAFSEVVSTRMGGPPELMALERTYFDTLRQVREYRFSEERLELRDGAGAVRAIFSPADTTPELAGTEWELKLLNGEAPPDDAKITASFTDDQVFGYAGVNRYFASYEGEGEALTFSEIGLTRRAGPGHLMAIESAYMEAIEATRQVRLMEGRLEMIDAAGQPRALFGLQRDEMTDLEIVDPGAPLDLAENQLWVPMRPVAEWLGATVTWDAETGTATAVRNGKEFRVDTRRNMGWGGGLEWTTGYSMMRPSGMVYVPLDALTHSLGGEVIRQPDDHVLILEIDGRRGTLDAP